MIDVVIPFLNSNGIDFELKYCLRAIEKYLSHHGNIFIIGGQPAWIKNHIHINFADVSGNEFKALNIYSKIAHACTDKRISDNFFCIADDVFLLDNYINDYSHCGLLSEAIQKYDDRQNYKKVLRNTANVLSNDAVNIGHGPIVYNKELFIRSAGSVNWKQNWGYACKVLYVNMNNLATDFKQDIKINTQRKYFSLNYELLYEDYFSINDGGINSDLMTILDELFPDKSQFEI